MASTEIKQVGTRCKLARYPELWLIVRLQVVARAGHVPYMGLAEAASESASGLHVVEERGMVAIVRKVDTPRLWPVPELHTCHN